MPFLQAGALWLTVPFTPNKHSNRKDTMYYQFCFGANPRGFDGYVIADTIDELDCPTEWGGVGSLTVSGHLEVWTGRVHLYCRSRSRDGIERISFGFSAVTEILTRSNM